MNPHRSAVHPFWTASLLLIGMGVAHAQVRTPTSPMPTPTRQTSTPTMTLPGGVQNSLALEPTVNQATPRSATVSIGGPIVQVTLSGSQLTPVTAVQVVDAAGIVQPHIEAHIDAHGRTGNALPLQLFAKKNARPNLYRLQLVMPADPREVQSRPQSAPLGGGSMRTLLVPTNIATIDVRAMEPKVTSMTPQRPIYNTYALPYFTLSDVPGNEIVSITRTERAHEGDCVYRLDSRVGSQPHYLGGVAHSSWIAPNTVQLNLHPGQFVGPVSSCRIRFTIRTKNAFGEEFYSLLPPFVVNVGAPPPPTRLPVSSTWALKDYLYLTPMLRKGICSGNSLGAHGSFPVGIVNANGQLSFRARSGPIGTNCEWKLYTERLEPGWTLHMNFRIRHVGNQCKATDGSTAQFDFSSLAKATIRSDGEFSLSSNLSQNGNAIWLVFLSCGATLSNDHEVTVEMVSASVSKVGPGANCDWRCAFR